MSAASATDLDFAFGDSSADIRFRIRGLEPGLQPRGRMNAETLLDYDVVLARADGEEVVPRACGRERADARWEGWIELDAVGRDLVYRTPVETMQPDRASLLGWAETLGEVYLEGAFDRAVPLAVGEAPTPNDTTSTKAKRRAAEAEAEAEAEADPPSLLDLAIVAARPWFRRRDSNPDKRNQNPLSCH